LQIRPVENRFVQVLDSIPLTVTAGVAGRRAQIAATA
jgi:hypothetical protein